MCVCVRERERERHSDIAGERECVRVCVCVKEREVFNTAVIRMPSDGTFSGVRGHVCTSLVPHDDSLGGFLN